MCNSSLNTDFLNHFSLTKVKGNGSLFSLPLGSHFNIPRPKIKIILESSDINKDVGALKSHLQPIIEIPPAMMKVMIKGLAKDKDTLAQLGVNKTSKVMVIGSSLSDVLQVSTVPSKSELKKREEEESKGLSSEHFLQIASKNINNFPA